LKRWDPEVVRQGFGPNQPIVVYIPALNCFESRDIAPLLLRPDTTPEICLTGTGTRRPTARIPPPLSLVEAIRRISGSRCSHTEERIVLGATPRLTCRGCHVPALRSSRLLSGDWLRASGRGPAAGGRRTLLGRAEGLPPATAAGSRLRLARAQTAGTARADAACCVCGCCHILAASGQSARSPATPCR
jgi:hypothetical protein